MFQSFTTKGSSPITWSEVSESFSVWFRVRCWFVTFTQKNLHAFSFLSRFLTHVNTYRFRALLTNLRFEFVICYLWNTNVKIGERKRIFEIWLIRHFCSQRIILLWIRNFIKIGGNLFYQGLIIPLNWTSFLALKHPYYFYS